MGILITLKLGIFGESYLGLSYRTVLCEWKIPIFKFNQKVYKSWKSKKVLLGKYSSIILLIMHITHAQLRQDDGIGMYLKNYISLKNSIKFQVWLWQLQLSTWICTEELRSMWWKWWELLPDDFFWVLFYQQHFYQCGFLM